MLINFNLSNFRRLKQDFRGVYRNKGDPDQAADRLRFWLLQPSPRPLKPICRFARGLLRGSDCFTAYSNTTSQPGPDSAFNNQTARLIHRSCGVTNLDCLFPKFRARALQKN